METQRLLGRPSSRPITPSTAASHAAVAAAEQVRAKKTKRSLNIVLFTVLVGSLMYTVALPSLPQMVSQLNAPSYVIGWAVSAFSIGQFIASPVVGWSSQREGGGALLPLCVCGGLLVVANILYACAWNKWILLVSRLVLGAGAANVSVCRSYAAEITPMEKRTGVLSLIAACQGIGFVMGPAIGAAMAPLDYKVKVGGSLYPNGEYKLNGATAPGWFSALLCLVNMLVIAFMFTDMTKGRGKAAVEKGDEVYDTVYGTDNSVADVPAKIPNRPTTPTTPVPDPLPVHLIPPRACCGAVDKTLDLFALLLCSAVFFLTITLFAAFETVLAEVLKLMYGWGTAEAGAVFGGCGIISIIAFLIIKPLERATSDRTVLCIGFVLMTVAGVLCIDWSGIGNNVPKPEFLAGQALFSIGYPFSSATVYAIFSKMLGGMEQGTAMGLLTSCGSVARTVGPLAAGYVLYYGHVRAVYLLVASVACAALLVSLASFSKLVGYDVLLDRKLAKYRGTRRLIIQSA